MGETRKSIEVEGLSHDGLPIPLASMKDGILVSGGIGAVDPATGQRVTGLVEEVAQVYRNIAAVLNAAGFAPDDVLKVTFFVSDPEFRGAINAGWEDLFPNSASRPARHTLVQSLSQGQHVQAEIFAIHR